MKEEPTPIVTESAPLEAAPPPSEAPSVPQTPELALAIAESAELVAASLPRLVETAILGYDYLLTQRDSPKYVKETADTVMEIVKVLPRKGDRGGGPSMAPPLASIPVTSLDTLFGGIVKLAQNAQTLQKERTVNG